MATLICQKYPQLSIFIPETGQWRSFQDGRLDIEEDDPHYDVVMAEAGRNPAIAIYQSVGTCPHCGEVEKSKAALESHIKDIHFDVWLASEDAAAAETRNVELKKRAGVFCDVCAPPQEFPNDEDLALHNRLVHQTGEESEAPAKKGRSKGVEAIPAATGKQQ